MLVLAHTGHWLIWVLYAVPLVIVLASIVITLVRRGEEDEETSESGQGRGQTP